MRETDDKYPDPITERVFSAIRDCGLTQTQVADSLDRHRQTLTNWRNRGVPADQLNALASLLDTTYSHLRYGSASDNPAPIESRIDPALVERILNRLDHSGRPVTNTERANAIAAHYARMEAEIAATIDRIMAEPRDYEDDYFPTD